ncbi:MAG: hypothetical protein V4667_08260 [Bacteroidota bacterium]
MLKDIPELKVQDIGVAIVNELNNEQEMEWNVYILNLKKEPIDGVLVSSTGYGEVNGDHKKSSTLRHFIEKIEALDFSKIEPIIEDVFSLTNEYWVSFRWNGNIYDKKFIFLPESICETNFVQIPLINKKGVIIK